MSTTPVTPAPVAGSLQAALNYFNNYALLAAQAAVQEQAEISAGDHLAAVNTAVATAAAAAVTAAPSQLNNVTAAFQLFTGAETLIVSIVNLFRHPKVAAQAAVAAVAPAK